ncbi:uncharacterized protein EI90DRAFT_3124664 [Cantharellus anzutake]|uniref:uncharacterized protein n=1 Tax=Cantharellus anzutake TaxID=1750568 RepID=UPI001904D6FA|nr:uncharacterized protein EI90DRAFT_3124664 [Cantharellus anzutake]KAF8330187.1 hypothetical protein EI90DRAFT_3124664 [Cantharellus anzutake]
MSENSPAANRQGSQSRREKALTKPLTVHVNGTGSASTSPEGRIRITSTRQPDADGHRIPSVLRAPPSPTSPVRTPRSLTAHNLPDLTFDATRTYPVAPSGDELFASFPAPSPHGSSVPIISSGQGHTLPPSQVFRGEERSFLGSPPSSPNHHSAPPSHSH